MSEPDIYFCDECNRDGIICELKTTGGAPLYCPMSGDDMKDGEWCKVAETSHTEAIATPQPPTTAIKPEIELAIPTKAPTEASVKSTLDIEPKTRVEKPKVAGGGLESKE